MLGFVFVVVGSWYIWEWARAGGSQRINTGDTILEEDGAESKESTYYNIARIRNILLSLLRYKHLPLELPDDHSNHSP